MRPAIAACLLLLGLGAHAAPDEQALGKSDGYPIQRLGPDFSLMTEQYKVGTFSNMESVFWPRRVATSGKASVLGRRAEPFELKWEYNGASYSLQDFLDRQRITGLLILKNDAIVVERYQYERKAEHHFTSMSMAKTVTGMLVGIALKEGRIVSLDDPAEKYAPALRGSAWGPVSVRNLLRMSSGVKWSDNVSAGGATDIGRLSAETFFQRGRGGASAITWVDDRVEEPGRRFNYSSAEAFALGLVLRGAIGVPLADYLSEKVWKRIGAESDAAWLVDWSGMEAAYCCLNARLRDYGRLGMLMAADGSWEGQEIVPREFMLDATDAERQPEYLKPRKATQFFGYGYQTWLYPFRTRTFQARGLFGQEIVVQPESRIVIVMTSVLKTPNVLSDIFVERNYFVGAVLKALGGKADVYR
jgi:CubicO group peptidase (beta-lactamase class C family)